MLCSATGDLGSENDTGGRELPILRAGFQTTDWYFVERTGLINSRGVRELILDFQYFGTWTVSFSPPLLFGGFLEAALSRALRSRGRKP